MNCPHCAQLRARIAVLEAKYEPNPWSEVTTVLGLSEVVRRNAEFRLRVDEVGAILSDLITRGFCRSADYYLRGTAATASNFDTTFLTWAESYDDLSTTVDPIDRQIASVFPTVRAIGQTIARCSAFTFSTTTRYSTLTGTFAVKD